MQHSYIVIDDTGNMHKHGHMFSSSSEAFAYVNTHKLGATHLVYDLSSASVVPVSYTHLTLPTICSV